MSETNDLVPIEMGERGVQLRTIEDAFRFATAVVQSGLAPKGDTPQAVVVKLQAGAELGLTPIRALSVLTSINGRVGIMANPAKALIQAAGVLVGAMDERVEGEGDARCGVVKSKRRGWSEARETRFSVADAKTAALWGKSGPWSLYPDRMLRARALGFHCADWYGDILLGLRLAEELQDIPRDNGRPSGPAELPAAMDDPLFATAALVESGTAEPAQGGNECRGCGTRLPDLADACPECGIRRGDQPGTIWRR